MPRPSGVNRGSSWWKSPPVSFRGAPPSAPTTKMARIVTRLNYRRDGSGYTPAGYRHIFVVGAALAALGFAGAAIAQTSAQKAQIDQAKAAGVVGEQADGYLGFRTSTSDAGLRAAEALAPFRKGRAH